MNRVCSIFSQLLQLFSRLEFEAAVQPHKAERHARGFAGWGQFVAMLFGQLGSGPQLARDLPRISRLRRETQAFRSANSPLALDLGLRQSASAWQLYQTVFLGAADPLSGTGPQRSTQVSLPE
jgi:hypothetical protein